MKNGWPIGPQETCGGGFSRSEWASHLNPPVRRGQSMLRFIIVGMFCASSACAGEPTVVDLWPGKAADDVGITGEEKTIDLKVNGKSYEIAGRPVKWITNVSKPTITIFRPAKEKDVGTAVLICPGGGYHNLAWDLEGEEVATWLNSLGITGIVLKYRVPRRPDDPKGEPPAGPLQDSQRAMSLVRSKAADWGLDAKRIGILGFSAGRHLAVATAT